MVQVTVQGRAGAVLQGEYGTQPMVRFWRGQGGNIIALAQELYASDSLPYLLERIAEQGARRASGLLFFWQADTLKTEFPTVGGGAALFPRLVFLSAAEGDKYGAGKKRMQGSALSDRRQTILCRRLPQPFGGYEIRNKLFKGCIAPKDITHIRQEQPRETCCLFEGFMDYLSFLTLRLERCPERPDLDGQDYIVLNSTSNLSKAIRPLDGYGRIHCFLDNDKAGMEAVQELREEYGLRVRDASHIYGGYNDLNDFLCGKRSGQAERRHGEAGTGGRTTAGKAA